MLDTLANVGEFLGGVAVIVTLIYLAIQTRANMRASRAQALSTWTTAAQLEKEVLFTNPDFARLYLQVVYEGKAPQGDEEIQFFSYCIQLMNTWQLAFIQWQLGVTKREFLDGVSSGYATVAASEAVRNWWKGDGHRMYDGKFVAYVDEQVARHTARA